MAWNPSPEVAAARDYGRKFGADQVIILHVNTRTGAMGYASYGATRKLCDDTKELADVAYGAMANHMTREPTK